MIRYFLHGIAYIAVGFFCLQNKALAADNLCQSAYQNWIGLYGYSDPYLAVQKTTPWPFSYSVLSQVRQDHIKFSEQDLAPFSFNSEDQKEKAKVAFEAKIKSVESLTSRDLAIRQNLVEFTQEHQSDVKELSIAYMGLYHAVDLFIVNPGLHATYINKPFDLGTLAIPKGTRDLQAALGITSPPKTVGEIAGSYYILPYLATAESLKSLGQRYLPKETFLVRPTDNHLLVISELHGLDSILWIQSLPTAECLKEIGITKIRLGLEGYAKGTSFTLEDILFRRSYLEQFNYRAQKLGLTLDQFFERVKIPTSIREKLKAGQIEDNLAIAALARKLLEYRSSGIIIRLQGIEATTYDALEGN